MSSDTAKTKESQRKHVRYTLSDDCRLKAAIKVRSADATTAAKEWPGMVVDMSAEGAHIQISLGAVAYIGDSCVVTLSHGGVKTEVRGSLAHYVCSSRYSVCGVRFDFTFGGADKAYQPFFQAIVASTPLKGGPVDSDVPLRYKEEYRGPGLAKLVLWRDNKPERTIVGFEYAMARYTAALASAGTDMFKNKSEVGFRAAAGATGSLSEGQEKEARWEFSLAASNLPKTIAPDIRRFLRLVS
jgi:hypothetical protein